MIEFRRALAKTLGPASKAEVWALYLLVLVIAIVIAEITLSTASRRANDNAERIGENHALIVASREERNHAIMVSCNEENARHKEAITGLVKFVSRNSPPRTHKRPTKRQSELARKKHRALEEFAGVFAPERNCAERLANLTRR